MLDGLLGRGFVAKCKSLIKPTKKRLEVLRKRAEAKQRFLKEDLAKLLSNGLDINAYGRTEEFLAGLCLLSHYEFIEYTCDFILKNLSVMQKQRECPENCREAVASLMFAAARFSDLPELRELRDAFQERYGNSIDHFVNQVFVDKLASRPPTLEKRLLLLQDIALEFSIKWDSRGFEQRMASPSGSVQDQYKKHVPPKVTSDRSKYSNGKGTDWDTDKHGVITKETSNIVSDGQTMRNGKEGIVSRRDEVDISFIRRQEYSENRKKALPITGGKGDENNISYLGRLEHPVEKHRTNQKDDTTPTVRSGSSSHGKSVDAGYMKQHGNNSTAPNKEKHDTVPRGKSEVSVNHSGFLNSVDGRSNSSVHNEYESRYNTEMSTKNVREEEPDRFKSFHSSPRPPPYVKLKDSVIPAPYIKPEGSNYESLSGSKHSKLDGDSSSIAPSPRIKTNGVVNSPRIQKDKDHPQTEEGFGLTRVNGHVHEKDPYYQNDIPLPKPRSHRRKPSKSSSNHHDGGIFEDTVTEKRGSSSRRKEHSRKGLQLLFDDEHHQKDEEERMMDKLLLHYSKKASAYDVGKLRKKSEARTSYHKDSSGSELRHLRNRDSPDLNPEMVPHPARSVSLPRQQTASSEPTKVYARANSFQPDSQAPHVHPKLPDYDDLAARFSALRGR